MKKLILLPGLFLVSMVMISCGGGSGSSISEATPLAVNTTTPAGNTTAVPLTAAITVTFNKAVDAASVTTDTFIVKDHTTTPMPGTVTSSGTSATFAPSASLANFTTYSVTLTTGIRDTTGSPLVGNYSWSFSTTSFPVGFTPVNESKSIPLGIPTVGQVASRGVSGYSISGLTPGSTHTVSIKDLTEAASLHVFSDATGSFELDCTLRTPSNSCTVQTGDTLFFSVSAGPLNREGAGFVILVL